MNLNTFLGTRNSEIVYFIVSSEYSRNFTIDSTRGIITPASPMDFEKLPVSQGHPEMAIRPLRLTIRAKDMGSPSLSSDVPLIIYLKDVNDNAPGFERAVYKRNIPEDLAGGTTVLQVRHIFTFQSFKPHINLKFQSIHYC